MNRKPLSLLALLILAGLILALGARPVPAGAFDATYHDLRVVRVSFTDRATVDQIAAWTEPWEVNYSKGYLIITVNQAQYNSLLAEGYQVEVDNTLTTELYRPRAPLPGQVDGIPGYPCYRTVEETFQTAQDIVTNHPTLASIIDAGDSWEKVTPGGNAGYDMLVLRLTNSAIAGPKPILFITSSIHAREYTPAELATRFAEYLINNYGSDADATWLLDYHEVHLMLHANPDGRKQAETGLSWRKNTNENYCGVTSTSRGADLNRNFEFQWGCCGGSSGSQCSDTYRGPSPASEPEVQAIQAYNRAIFPDQRGPNLTDPAPVDATGVYMDIHSYSELVLWPWGFTSTPAPNATALTTLGRKFAYFNGYTPEQAIGLYPTDGTTDDFVYGDLGVPGYTFELGTDFFQDCSTFENSILPDNMPSLVYAAKVARTPYMTPAGPDALNLAFDNAAVPPGTLVNLTATLNDTRYNNSNGSEPTQNIAAGEYYIDTPPWAAGTPGTMNPADGSFNSSVEGATASLDTTGLPSGKHIVFVRGQDAAGNWGAVSAAFLYIIDPNVAPILEGFVRDADTNAPLAATVNLGDQFQTTTNPVTGYYQIQVISGTYDITATAADHAPQTVSNVTLSDFQTLQQDFDLQPVCTAFFDDVESGNAGWTAQSPWAITTEAAHSPTHAWTDSPGGNYANNRNVALTSPILDLSDYDEVFLNYWQICDTESGYDYCRVEVSTNGTTWIEMAAYDGPGNQWEEVNLALPALANQPQARLRFRFTSDVSVTADGWHLDDVRLFGPGSACSQAIAPTANFTSNSPIPAGDPVNFTNLSVGTDLTFEWNFGDGSPISTLTNPSHVYATPMTYTVTLTATNSLGSDAFSDQVVVTETGVAPTAFFTPSATQVNVGEAVSFSNGSTGSNLTFAWDFGDGSPASSDTNPSHTFALPGTYLVTLTASNGLGSDSYSVEIHVSQPLYLYLPFITLPQ